MTIELAIALVVSAAFGASTYWLGYIMGKARQ